MLLIELKFTWNDPCDTLNILKMKWKVMSEVKNKMAAIKVKFAQHAPIDLKFAWNDDNPQ